MTAILTFVFLLFVALCLAFDMGFFNRKPHAPSVREAILWSAVWVALSCGVGALFWVTQGADAGTRWFTAYVMEKALSMDNLFVFSLVFAYFNIPAKYRHRVLVWGIIGAVVLRLTLIAAGVGLVSMFGWVLYLFGAFLVYAGIKLLVIGDDDDNDVENSLAVRLAKRFIPYIGIRSPTRFFVKITETVNMGDGNTPAMRTKTYATRLFLCLVAIELSDVIFAVDSVPVVVSISQDFLIAFTSNIMAILGLRALFFLLQHLLDRLHYLPLALGAILTFIGVKMLAVDVVHISPAQSLAVVVALLAAGVGASLLKRS